MKKLLSLILTLLMVSTLIVAAIPVSAADSDLNFTLTNAAGMPNDEITVELKLDKNDGFYSFWFMLYYDDTALSLQTSKTEYHEKLTSVGEFTESKDQSADKFTGPVTKRVFDSLPSYNISTADKSFMIFYFESDDITNDVQFDGTVAKFTFQILGIAEEGTYKIGLMPDRKMFINNDMEDLSVSWTDAVVEVGSTKVPKETLPVMTPDDTVDPSEVTDAPEVKGREDFESEALDIETFKADDGKTYYYDEDGETVELESDSPLLTDTADSKETDAVSDVIADGETEKAEDVKKENEEKESKSKTVDIFGLNIPFYFVIIAAILVLIAIAAVLFVLISKTKKTDNENNN